MEGPHTGKLQQQAWAHFILKNGRLYQSMEHRTHRALGIPPGRVACMPRVWGAAESLGRKSYMLALCRNPALSVEYGENQSCQAPRGRKGSS